MSRGIGIRSYDVTELVDFVEQPNGSVRIDPLLASICPNRYCYNGWVPWSGPNGGSPGTWCRHPDCPYRTRP